MVTLPLDSTACSQADEVFYCLHKNDPDRIEQGIFDASDNRLALSGTNPKHKDFRSEWCQLYEDIKDHNLGGSKSFPSCSDPSHQHHPTNCTHCLNPTDDPADNPSQDDPADNIDPIDPCEHCQTANLSVIVKDADGNPVENAIVFVDGLGGNLTNSSGVADYGEVTPGTYDVSGEKDGHGPTKTDPVGSSEKPFQAVPGGQTTVIDLQLHPVVAVTIVLNQPVACPGHPLKITATGIPAGGTFAWTVNGHGAELVDAAGTAVSTGATVHMRCFRPDNGTGEIPERKVTVEVKYTSATLGTASANDEITVHKIKFDVTNATVASGGTEAFDNAGGVALSNSGGVATVSTTPDVEIKLDAACPRKSDCAKNHEVGWLQTLLTNTRTWHYSHTDWSLDPNFLPMRDSFGPRPWYDSSSQFTGNNDTKAAHFEDSPRQSAPWVDSRLGAPTPPPATNQQLTRFVFQNSFHTWLVVRNTEWWGHDEAGSFAFQRNFTWSCSLTLAVDTTQAVGSRCTPTSNAATVSALGNGMGGVTPIITAPFPNTNHTITHVP